MCARTPIVGFNAGGINDMVCDGSTGLLASPAEGIAGLTRLMLTLGRDRDARETLGAEAQRSSFRYHIPTATLRLLEVYDQATREAHSRP
jgi:glycosyltransferase involved in cell wall biosynthesis